MVAPQTPPEHREGTPPTLLRRRMVAGHGGTTAVRPGEGAHHALPIPGSGDPLPLAGHGLRTQRATAGLWSARCPETGTPGAGGGSGKPTGGNTGRAPRVDLTRGGFR